MRLIGYVFPRSRAVRRHQLRKLAADFEHDAAVMEASRSVAEAIDGLGELSGVDPAVTQECREVYEHFAGEAMERLDTVAEHFPEYVQAVQLQTAQRIALDSEADAVGQLASAGGIPPSVASEARRMVEQEQRRLMRQPVAALEPNPQDLLARVPFFQDLEQADFEMVVERLRERTVLPGETIIRQGERGDSLFLIARGVVAVVFAAPGEQPRRVASLHAGEFFGEMALITQEPRSATVEAITGCHLYELLSSDVDQLCDVCGGVRDALVQAYEERRRPARRSSIVS